MASTYSNLKIELIGTGEQSGTWGSTTNTNLGTAIEEAICESADVTFSSSNVTLTLTDTNGSQTARHLRLNLTGTAGGPLDLTVPAIEKNYIVYNGTDGVITVKNPTGADEVDVPVGKSIEVYSTGAGVVPVTTHLTSLTLGSALPVASGGTGATSLTANNVILGNGTSAVQVVAPGTSGNVLTSNGTTWVSGTSFSAGMIMLWSGSIASIPSGWVLCNGSNGTPDLRDRFVVGAGSTYAVNATGGSADAIVVSHTHTATSTVTDPGHNHSLVAGQEAVGAGGDTGYRQNSGVTGTSTTGITVATSIASSGSSGTNANLPPYYALAYIMKT